MDLAGDGQLDVVGFGGPRPGFSERTTDEDWQPFRPFGSLPNIRWADPNLRFVDLTGDGLADVLITEDEVFTWHSSLGEEGFGPAEKVQQAGDEEKGPRRRFLEMGGIFLTPMPQPVLKIAHQFAIIRGRTRGRRPLDRE